MPRRKVIICVLIHLKNDGETFFTENQEKGRQMSRLCRSKKKTKAFRCCFCVSADARHLKSACSVTESEKRGKQLTDREGTTKHVGNRERMSATSKKRKREGGGGDRWRSA